ncbi:TRAF-type zinc finger domain-containing protein 1-like isoform X2 [Colias croceus]|uniref:TRAF-type zinc finger domain-containing protein 1-like isoform X2 n=1 Tax=Colias crocea TaxID=72248 RepID=UPI001E27C0B1|nr:TRAF-type zinc finger domain-containing protein 1-like isoform X2 [Colias croceus]
MDEVETKTCENCKRDIPADNFTIHSIHCARNIRMCPVCKEPFPHAELQEHHEKMHKLLPCKQCGESVCGTDLEDHIRDSCAHTMQTCKYCTLDLRRGELPAHERYCGARTEQCEQCGEWVMMRYRQLHLDSNHGFLRLDDDPPPFRKDKPNKIFNDWAKPANGIKKPDIIKDINVPRPTEIRYFQPSTSSNGTKNRRPVNEMIQRTVNENKQRQVNEMIQRTVNENKNRPVNEMNHRPVNEVKQRTVNQITETNVEPRASSSNGAVPRPKRTNDQPQINTNVAPTNKVNKNMPMSRGAIKKRPAPKPPADPLRELPYRRALLRQQEEQRVLREKNAENLAKGLPPVLTPLEKLEKLRKMDALHNREIDDQSYKNRLNGRIWMAPDIPSGHVLGSAGSSRNTEQAQIDLEVERRKKEFKNLKPMTPEEFIERFNELQLKEPKERKNGDRFSQIKSSLRELRRDLNEVTAPYNANNASADVNQKSPEEVRLPCEFCGEAVPLDDLVQHETGCRPDLARVPPRSRSASPPPDQHGGIAQAAPRSSPPAETVIPCEFCARSLPVYLISEHQERCGRESNLLFAD